MVFDLIKLALHAKDINALLEFFIDHKKYLKCQGKNGKYISSNSVFTLFIFSILEGHGLGILIRLCWITLNGDHQSFSLLMNLISVSSVDNEKSNKKTAELLRDFIVNNGLDQFGGKLTLTADHLLAGHIAQDLKAVGLDRLADFLGICNSHSHQNIFKRLLSQVAEMAMNDQHEGNFLIKSQCRIPSL